MNREQYKLLDRITRLFSRVECGIDSYGMLVRLVVITELALDDAGLVLEPAALEWMPPRPKPSGDPL